MMTVLLSPAALRRYALTSLIRARGFLCEHWAPAKEFLGQNRPQGTPDKGTS